MNQVEINGHLQKPKDHSTSCSSAKLLLQTTCPSAPPKRARAHAVSLPTRKNRKIDGRFRVVKFEIFESSQRKGVASWLVFF
jgi:hypothetical protein